MGGLTGLFFRYCCADSEAHPGLQPHIVRFLVACLRGWLTWGSCLKVYDMSIERGAGQQTAWLSCHCCLVACVELVCCSNLPSMAYKLTHNCPVGHSIHFLPEPTQQIVPGWVGHGTGAVWLNLLSGLLC